MSVTPNRIDDDGGDTVLRPGTGGRPVRVAVRRDGEGLRMEVDHG